MKKRLIVALSLLLMVCMPFSAGADVLYARDCAAGYLLPAYSAPLREQNQAAADAATHYDPASEAATARLLAAYEERLATAEAYAQAVAVLSADLMIRLIDYDVALKRLSLQMERYEDLYGAYREAQQAYKLGQMDGKTLMAVQAEREQAYLELRTAVRDISIAKEEIEGVTGETLKDSFDFESLYYITDAMKLDTEMSERATGWDTICAPAGYVAPDSAGTDGTAELNAARDAYFELGQRLHAYVAAARQYETAKRDFMLGRADREALSAAERAADDGYLAVCTAKAAYAKSLITLDLVLGGTLIPVTAPGEVLVAAYAQTLPADPQGEGLWWIRRVGNSKVFSPVNPPFTVLNGTLCYEIRYGGAIIGSSADGGACTLADTAYLPEEPWAEITFTLDDGTLLGQYRIDVFSPIGCFYP